MNTRMKSLQRNKVIALLIPVILALVIVGLSVTGAQDDMTETRVFFSQPTDGARVPPIFEVVMGAEGLEIEPLGEVHDAVGHFHILIDTDFIEAGEAIPNDEQHRHFGDGSNTASLELAPGSHTLRLQVADGAHIAQEGAAYRDEIVVSVAEDTPGRAVRFVTPTDGSIVPTTFTVKMAAAGLVIEPSGEVHDDAGHFHILIDTDFIEAGEVIPNDEQHRHFGTGATETELELEPGEHTLRLQVANGAHLALEGDDFRDEMTVNVVEDASAEQVMFVDPADGATVSETFSLRWAAAGLIIEPAGRVLRVESGHLHVLIDEEFIEPGEVVPNDDTHRHFGGGQSGTELTLEPGTYTLRLQMANGAHLALEGDSYRDEITINVE